LWAAAEKMGAALGLKWLQRREFIDWRGGERGELGAGRTTLGTNLETTAGTNLETTAKSYTADCGSE